jgi:hypothetical protein
LREPNGHILKIGFYEVLECLTNLVGRFVWAPFGLPAGLPLTPFSNGIVSICIYQLNNPLCKMVVVCCLKSLLVLFDVTVSNVAGSA